MSEHKKKKLNECLDIYKFEICVPLGCKLWREGVKDVSQEKVPPNLDKAIEKELENSEKESAQEEKMKWLTYEKSLRKAVGLPDNLDTKDVEDWFCAVPGCWPRWGWKLTGPAAIEHARRVHAKIQRQALRFKNVSAVDVGFAVWEKRRRFLNLLAIRIHVAKKHPIRHLEKEGLPRFNDPRYAIDKETYSRVSPQGNVAGSVINLDQFAEICSIPKECLEDLFFGTGISKENLEDFLKGYATLDYPLPGISKHDLSVHVSWLCPDSNECWIRTETREPSDSPCPSDIKCFCRLAICGVPLDIIDALYFPSARHPGGDAPQGVFVDPLETSVELSNAEQLLTGRGRVNPLVGGVSIGTVGGQAGTLGTIVWDRTDGTPCVLSNWHILAGSGRAQVGQPCYQPALFDGGTTDDTIAHLKRWHLGDLGDAAIAELDCRRHYASGEILGMWHPISGYKAPELNLEVRKWGRTTGFTEGFIDGVYLATNIDYGGGFIRHFRNQFHIAPLYPGQDVSQVGDSGSLVLTKYDLDDLEILADAVIRAAGVPAFLKEFCRDLPKHQEDLVEFCRELLAKHLFSVADHGAELEEAEKVLREAVDGGSGRRPDGNQGVTSTLPPDFPEALQRFLAAWLSEHGVDLETFFAEKIQAHHREARNIYYAVGMIFAGDTPGSPFGEFALASDIEPLAEDLRFSLRPVFEPRSSFRELRNRPDAGRAGAGGRRGRQRSPGEQRDDPRGQGPQPEGEPLNPGPGSGG